MSEQELEHPQQFTSVPTGEVLLAWDMPSHTVYNRGWLWYLIAGALGMALIISAVVTANYLFAIIVFILAIIIALTALRPPEAIPIHLTETGCAIGRRFYRYRELAQFAIVYQPPVVRNLYLEFKTGARPRITIDLCDQNPLEIREILGTHVKENVDQTEEPFSDLMGRVLKI